MYNKHKVIMKPKVFVIPLIIIYQLVFNTSVGVAWILPSSSQSIPAGITVNDKKIGGMKREQAISYLETLHVRATLDKEIILKDGSEEWRLNTKDCGFRYDYAKTIDAVFARTQWEGSDKIANVLKLQARNLDMPFELTWDQKKLDYFLGSINQQVMKPARDASLDYSDGIILLTREQSGEEIDIEMLKKRIIHSLQYNQKVVHIVKKTIFPRVKITDLQKVDADLAYFTTEIPSTEGANRYNNIVLAAQILNGAVIMPGETFSFNEKVGERSSESGFKKAPVIIGNVVHQDLGGGVCQVASTLYNVSLLAGLEIVERSAHTIPVKYVPEGKDATVFYGLIDLKIKNTLPNPVVIQCEVNDNEITMRLLGHQGDGCAYTNASVSTTVSLMPLTF